MIKINIPSTLPANIEKWKTKAEEITESIIKAPTLLEKQTLINKYQGHWRDPDLIQWLSDLSAEKCWYTETKFGGDYQEVEHFRPKKETKDIHGQAVDGHPGYYWLAFNIVNYRLCKRRPNAKKGTFFPIRNEHLRAMSELWTWQDELPLFLDPTDDEDCILLSFNDDGRPVPNEGLADSDVTRVDFTIEKYYLDERVLNKRRAETWSACRELYYKYLNSVKLASVGLNGSVTHTAQAKKDLQTIKEMLRPNREFAAVARQSLIKIGDRLAQTIASSS
ncbi:hypothetical protein NHH82_32090 [Oxalobacteraceae bacterium OTU3REALA1]|nr:hypothetical protein NHH82_32090 [Oxalobacteraceae bacterium OTU3REALA1]